MRRYAVAATVFALLTACASTKPDLLEARKVVGTENNVRFDAEIYSDQLGPNVMMPVKYWVTNERPTTILIADLLPDASYDSDTRTVTITIGSEVPGQEFLPRLIPVHSGESKSFSATAHVVVRGFASPLVAPPAALRLRLNFLGGSSVPFEKLIAIPQRAVRDPALAAQIFPKWIEGNETVVTNTLPMHWVGGASEEPTPAAMPDRRGAN